jgi:hypothetical protein
VRLPLPLVEVWEDLQPRVEQLTGEAGLQVLRRFRKTKCRSA